MKNESYQDYDVEVTTVAIYRMVATDKEHSGELGVRDAANRLAWDKLVSITATDVKRVKDKIGPLDWTECSCAQCVEIRRREAMADTEDKIFGVPV